VSALVRAPTPCLLPGDDRDRGIEPLLHPGLEQQRHLDDSSRRRGSQRAYVLEPAGDAGSDQWPQQPLQPAPLVLAACERLGGNHTAVDHPRRRNVVSPALDHGVTHKLVPIELMYNDVGGEDLRPQFLQSGQRR
jgi:hypothetical protein